MKGYRFAFVALLLVVGCGGGSSPADPVGNTPVGSWTLIRLDGLQPPVRITPFWGDTMGIVVNDELTVNNDGTLVESGTFTSSGVFSAPYYWTPTGTPFTARDQGTFKLLATGSWTLSFPGSGRTGTMSLGGWNTLFLSIGDGARTYTRK